MRIDVEIVEKLARALQETSNDGMRWEKLSPFKQGDWRGRARDLMRDHHITVAETFCTCTPPPFGDGPEIDCPVHGQTPADRALNRISSACQMSKYKVPGRPETYDQYHEGAADLASSILTIIQEET